MISSSKASGFDTDISPLIIGITESIDNWIILFATSYGTRSITAAHLSAGMAITWTGRETCWFEFQPQSLIGHKFIIERDGVDFIRGTLAAWIKWFVVEPE